MKKIIAALLALATSASAQQPDVILYNGKIFTSDRSALWAEAIAITGDRISSIGKQETVLKLKKDNTRLIDLRGHLVVPGFNDSHAHIGAEYPGRRITISENPADPTLWPVVRDSVDNVVKSLPAGMLIEVTVNPDIFEDKRVRRSNLDSLAPHHPVILGAWSGHGEIHNSLALNLVGIGKETVIAGSWLEKDASGNLTGYIQEYAGFRTTSVLHEKLSRTKVVNDIKAFHKFTSGLGITTMQNMCSAFSARQVVEVYAEPSFPSRTRLIAFPLPDKRSLQLSEWAPMFRVFNDRTYGSGIKMILDGTPLERLACMRTSYNDVRTFGKLNFSPSALREFMEFAIAHNQQILIHAVGDSSIHTIIRTMRQMDSDSLWKGRRLRIEHGEMVVVNKVDVKALKDLGIVVVQNPLHLALPQIMAQRFDRTKFQHLQAMRTLLDNGIALALGSDGPPNPFLNLMFASIHPTNPNERITLEEAVIAYTYGSAYAEFMEKDKGTLSKGKLADLAVLSHNIFEIPVQQLPATESILTILGGKIVHDKHVFK